MSKREDDVMRTDSATTNPATSAVFQVELRRDLVEAAGPDTATFLQGQLSQDVAGLAVGESRYSLLLQPQGKVDAWLQVIRTGDETFVLDVEGGWGDVVIRRLERFKLRTRCSLALLDGWRCWSVRGIDASAVPEAIGSTALVVAAHWPGAAGFDVLGVDLGPLDGFAVADADRYLEARIAAGVPALGAELDDTTIPAEAGSWLIERSVNFTKGCYTGQELVARVDSRGSNTPRKLRLVEAEGGLVVGAELFAGQEPVGVVTSAAADGRSALAYLKRSVEPPVTVELADGVAVRVDPLPEG